MKPQDPTSLRGLTISRNTDQYEITLPLIVLMLEIEEGESFEIFEDSIFLKLRVNCVIKQTC